MASYKYEHLHITSTDPEKTAEFYTRFMGAKFVKEAEVLGMKMIDMELGGIIFRISRGTGADANWTGTRFGLHHHGIQVDNLDKIIADLRANNVEFVVEPFEPVPGVSAIFVKAPDNVLIEVIEKKES
ncbi:VOC family protein [Chloroflexota bacterium]